MSSQGKSSFQFSAAIVTFYELGDFEISRGSVFVF